MKLRKIPAPDFDLEETLKSGQVFHWEKVDNGFVGTIRDQPVYLKQRGESLLVSPGASELVWNYFALDHPLAEICASFPDDEAMRSAREFCRGLRIIRQPKWECLATFICSSMKQVEHIRQISRKLRERFGRRQKIGEFVVHTFPSAARIAHSSETELRECALGYRAKNLLASARLVANAGVDLDEMSALSDLHLRTALCKLPGVGAKVANCVMLFAYERLRAFPIDVWIERVLRDRYFAGKRKITSQRLRRFTESYFGEHGGYAQQYLFHHARLTRHLSARRR
jgi:N-glycosylase/DNA lyase